MSLRWRIRVAARVTGAVEPDDARTVVGQIRDNPGFGSGGGFPESSRSPIRVALRGQLKPPVEKRAVVWQSVVQAQQSGVGRDQ